MSDPKRYAVEGVKQNNDLVSATVTIGPDANGDWVRYEDYARLKAEVERLTKESDILQKCCEHQKNRIERLKQNEQLIDAGNVLHDAAKIALKWGVTATQMGMPRALYDACRNWKSAKGVQS